jgi:hypothetical protein
MAAYPGRGDGSQRYSKSGSRSHKVPGNQHLTREVLEPATSTGPESLRVATGMTLTRYPRMPYSERNRAAPILAAMTDGHRLAVLPRWYLLP